MNEIDLALKKNKNQMVMRVVALILIVLALISWVLSPEKNTPIEKDEILENEKVSFNVSLDTLENAYKDFPSRKEVNVIDNNPFSSDKKDSDDMILEILDEIEKEETPSQANPYTNDNDSEKERDQNTSDTVENAEEDIPFAFYEADNMSAKIDIINESSKGFEQLLRVETSGRQIVSDDNPYLKVRLLEDFAFNGNIIPKNTYLMANATFYKERVFFSITGIQVDNRILETDMEIYDTYGNKGLELTRGKTKPKVIEINQELSQEYNRQINNRGGGIFRELLRAKPKLDIENKVILLKLISKK